MIRIICTTTDKPASEAKAIAGNLIPFRAPHHTTSAAGLCDELRLAVGGVLYLDNVGEFGRGPLSQLAHRIAYGGPLPLAIVVDVLNPYRPGVLLVNAANASGYANRVQQILDQLNDAVEQLRQREQERGQ